MKRFLKTICCVLIAVLMPCVCIGLTACEDIKELEVKISVFNTETEAQEELVLTVDLYRHLAPETVDKIVSYVEQGYYNDVLFHKDSFYTNIMLGDYKVVDGKIERNIADYVEPIYGEFSANGTAIKGEWKNAEGYIGLWRTWQADGNYDTNSDTGFNSGKATWFIPSEAKAEYDGYFCFFGKIDLSEVGGANETNLNILQATLNSANHYTTFAEYYTGEIAYNEDGSINYEGLEYHRILASEYNEKFDEEEKTIDGEKVFEAEGAQFACYNKRDVILPVALTDGKVTSVYAKIVTITVK